jgi:hypothetical protein
MAPIDSALTVCWTACGRKAIAVASKSVNAAKIDAAIESPAPRWANMTSARHSTMA